MAQFYPDVPLSGIQPDSERRVAQALRALPDDYMVLHSFSWLRPNRDLESEPLREGEADFVVVHPDRGLLVVEVKGGSPECVNRKWRRGGRDMRDPFEQARRNRFALLQALEERTSKALTRKDFPHGDVVIFPHDRFRGEVPISSDPRVVIDSAGMEALPERIEAAYAAWTKREARLSPAQMTLLRDALMPTLRLVRCGPSQIAAEQERFIQLTTDQQQVLSGLLDNERVVVSGTAGSGKTLLALEFALTLTGQGKRVFLLCFNKNLCAWLQEQARKDPRGGDRLAVSTFHALALKLVKRAGVALPDPAEQGQDFWDVVLPSALEGCLTTLSSHEHLADAIIVDEAQDFAPDWWRSLEALLPAGQPHRFYAFMDLAQSLRGHASPPPIADAVPFKLTANCRNTKAIARGAASLAQIETRLLPGAPEGVPPSRIPVASAADAAEEIALIRREVQRLREEGMRTQNVVLLGPAGLRKGPLASVQELAGLPLIDDASDWRRGKGLLVSTAKAFKGLEAAVVILYGLTGFGELFSERDLYVAWTRACNRLIVICRPGAASALIDAAIEKCHAERPSSQGQGAVDRVVK